MFSKRNGFATNPPISYRHDAPEELRQAVVDAAYLRLSYDDIRTSVCRTLRLAPNRGNWSEIPYIRAEVEGIVHGVE